MTRILIIEDEPNMRMGLRDNLEFEGYEVDIAVDGEEGLTSALGKKFDLILLDVMLPKISGFEVCKQVRAKGVTTPIILITAKGEEIDKVLGLELGADDYVTKPFSLRELIARIKAVLRRGGAERESEENLVIGQLSVNFRTYSASINDAEVQMSHKEYEILKFLWHNKNSTVSRDTLLNEIWGYEENPTTRTVDNFIMRLRQKIETDPNHPKFILTVHGIGYKLVMA
ncbi:MAG: response regulator transcription factor [Ignavibacteriales bacterium]|jgi:Response regulators consisting of a CheY-like receiver domain and a winged-helix DNA-binding domain|nr:MAG: response regulator transcription factor [Ignavibacteriaceae bacterium]MBW7873226.1 response regulator transcription factor [Ignavibacteria bacterium]MCZ2142868.1 response regulator transcription factor [Ignavibacteriales bacterium]OQY70990.1 MAG: DNA-binding response regulator [Ignavibacteriales bacterium UTCHB3]MBV6443962.1 Alkaline phosphatase synthesis transcriptional regulatory protein PhoP [Ignavibacteriaceae bacterium]